MLKSPIHNQLIALSSKDIKGFLSDLGEAVAVIVSKDPVRFISLSIVLVSGMSNRSIEIGHCNFSSLLLRDEDHLVKRDITNSRTLIGHIWPPNIKYFFMLSNI